MKSSIIFGLWSLCPISLAVETGFYYMVDVPFGYFNVLKTYKKTGSVVKCAALCQVYPQNSKKCDGFRLTEEDCKLLVVDWRKKPGSVQRVDVYVDKDLKVAGSDYKVISEEIYDHRFHAKYMLDDLKNDICWGYEAYWEGPKHKSPVSVKFDTILPINVRKIRLKNNHEDGGD